MNILCAGLNHQNAPIEVREKFAVGQHELAETLDAVRTIDGLSGAVILSTCNRVEFYASSICPVRTIDGLRGLMRERTGYDAPLYIHDTTRSVQHLFRVASGLDSMVIGETEILGQVKKAYSSAAELGATTRHLNKLFQHAFRVAKHVRTETQITRGSTSVGSVAVDLAGKIFGDLSGKRVMILGAGETSERTARSLVSRGVKTVIVSNRTFDRAAKLAEEIGGLAIHFDHWQNAFADIDILICSTSAPHAIVRHDQLAPMMKARPGRPLFIIDLAVPRDVEAAVNKLDGVFLYDIDSLEGIVRQSIETRRSEVIRCEQMISHHVRSFVNWLRHHHEISRL
ncbi:glutamyl-tRNA reductase [Terrimicrobium sacchariphilum]|jgi:glutamyl-tRNA reductase|uniref:Glutamyl-tRNA reductase n=1 Tax=Terrimicrobium sacchariphilum TaxID=690879 RepID=A0A146G4D4_TERSA|nr:glutamyl-tRNA reductase [Terrimicrobium sacchariphilum]GAT31656.1 glutamyl-tRNA reductase [Terrimicrobium sacchariphilum]